MRTTLFAALAALILVAGLAQARAAEGPAQRLCPVTGTALAGVATPVEARSDGFRFLVADAASRDAAQADPTAAFAALARNGDAAVPVSQACPVMGNRINPALFVQRDGRRVYMCCKGCTKRIENNWQGMLDKLDEQGETGDPGDLPSM